MTTMPTLRPRVDELLRAGAIAFGLAALTSMASVFSSTTHDPHTIEVRPRGEQRQLPTGDESGGLRPHAGDPWHVRVDDHRADSCPALGPRWTGRYRRRSWSLRPGTGYAMFIMPLPVS